MSELPGRSEFLAGEVQRLRDRVAELERLRSQDASNFAKVRDSLDELTKFVYRDSKEATRWLGELDERVTELEPVVFPNLPGDVCAVDRIVPLTPEKDQRRSEHLDCRPKGSGKDASKKD